MILSDEEKRRYARQMILLEIGKDGQERLKSAKVLVIGAGGLGSPALLYLAAAGIGTIGIADYDKVDLSNLHRQIIHETTEIGRHKTESAADTISDLNPNIKTKLITQKIDEQNAAEIVSDYNVVLDGSDNFETRFAVHDACFSASKPYISAAVLGFEGQLSVFKGYEDDQPCYRCFNPEIPPAGTIPTCSENGILGTVTGIMGAWQANEAIKEILEIGDSLSGKLIIFNGLTSEIRKVSISKDTACSLCSEKIKNPVSKKLSA